MESQQNLDPNLSENLESNSPSSRHKLEPDDSPTKIV